MKNFGKFITRMLAEGKTPKTIAKLAAERGGTKATLKASLAKFVDPNKVKVGNKMMAFMPTKRQEVAKATTGGAGAGSTKLKEATKKATTKKDTKKKTTTKKDTKKKTTSKKVTEKKASIPLSKGVKGGKIKLGRWLTTNKDVKSPAALYQKFKKEYPNATKQNIEAALANITDEKKKKNAVMIYKSLPNSKKGNPGTTSKNKKGDYLGTLDDKIIVPKKKVKRPYGGKVYDPNKKVKRMGGGQIGHNGNYEVSRLYTSY
tara:strand:+ start:92 stop:871 length:780 start_codon:yes stop_codon:yes gene_type:complete